MMRSTGGKKKRMLLVGNVLLLLAVSTGATTIQAAPLKPQNCRAIPDYADSSIIVEWDDGSGELGYRVYRSDDGGAFVQIGDDLAADVTTLIDPGRSQAAEYEYKIRAFDSTGESDDSNLFQQNVQIVWPNPGNLAVLHNWNETIGAAATAGFHKGADIQNVGITQNQIVFPRGGIVARVGHQGTDNCHIYTEIRLGSDRRYDSFNHLKCGSVEDLDYVVGDYVRAGQAMEQIGRKVFGSGGIDFLDHVHFFIPSDPISNAVDGEHPLKIFTDDEERDPRNTRPQLYDHSASTAGGVLYHRQGAATGPPYLAAPLGDDPGTAEDEGDVDIHVEIADLMGDGATQVPTSIAYWIEGRDCDDNPAVVKGPAEPYRLYRWDSKLFRDEGVNYRHIVDESQDLADDISYDGQNYPTNWDNFKHFIITNTGGIDGEPGNVDEMQYWNTNAQTDGSAATVAYANFATWPDTVRAEDARFPDGDYAIHISMTDLVGSLTETIQSVQLENFLPAVQSRAILVAEPPDVDSIMIHFSEPMDQAAVEAATTFEAGGEPFANTPIWSANGCILTILPDEPPDPAVEFTVTIDADTAVDLEGRPLDGEFGHPAHNGTAEGVPTDSVTGRFVFGDIAEVVGVVISMPEPGDALLSWPAVAGAETYAVTRGALSSLTVGQYGLCLAPNQNEASLLDAELPPSREGFLYLLQGKNSIAQSGTLGEGPVGTERVNQNLEACIQD
jgi:hypothetical protein